MSNLLAILLVALSAPLSHAEPIIIANAFPMNTQLCAAAGNLSEAYEGSLKNLATLDKKIAEEKVGSPKYVELMKLKTQWVNATDGILESLKAYSNSQMAVAVVQFDRTYTIPAERLSDKAGRIEITPKSSLNGQVTINSPSAQIVFYGAKFCGEMVRFNGDKAAALLVAMQKLFEGQ